jgi:transcriptional regulator with XRE-family HTH domain
MSLDQLGFPGAMREKSRELAFRLGVDESLASAFLSGNALPDYEALLALCELTQKSPGYFLDPSADELPQGTRVVPAIGPGEDLAICLPDDMARGSAAGAAELSYFRARRDMGFGVRAGDCILAVLVPMEPASMQKDHIYLVGCETGFDLRRCVVQTPVRAAFTSFDGKSAQTIKPHVAAVGQERASFRTEGLGDEIHAFAEVIGLLRSPQNLPLEPHALDFQT